MFVHVCRLCLILFVSQFSTRPWRINFWGIWRCLWTLMLASCMCWHQRYLHLRLTAPSGRFSHNIFLSQSIMTSTEPSPEGIGNKSKNKNLSFSLPSSPHRSPIAACRSPLATHLLRSPLTARRSPQVDLHHFLIFSLFNWNCNLTKFRSKKFKRGLQFQSNLHSNFRLTLAIQICIQSNLHSIDNDFFTGFIFKYEFFIHSDWNRNLERLSGWWDLPETRIGIDFSLHQKAFSSTIPKDQ